ncbi:MAG TPA: GNAT family N-acetyltransferase [Candidatus Tyrphobacter sp.]
MAGLNDALEIRPGDARDWPFVEALGARSVESSRGREAPEAFLRAGYERLLDLVATQSHVLLVARLHGRAIGFLILLDALPDEVSLQPQGFIAFMAVEPDSCGRGVGTALLNAAEDEARRRGLPYMSLMVTENNEAARRLYERGGYRTERRLLCKAL